MTTVPEVAGRRTPGVAQRVQGWLASIVRTPPLVPWRIGAAFAVAIAVDGAQLALGPLGWAGADEVLDVAATVAMIPLLGPHPLLLPTFVLELIPGVDALPTWTACVAFVVAHRRRQARTA